jgi:hypothetical protein
MLEQQKPIADPAATTLVRQLVLQLPGGSVGNRPEVFDGEDAAMRRKEGMIIGDRAMRGVAVGPPGT